MTGVSAQITCSRNTN